MGTHRRSSEVRTIVAVVVSAVLVSVVGRAGSAGAVQVPAPQPSATAAIPWSVVGGQDVGTARLQRSVSCPTSTFCLTVGEFTSPLTGLNQPLIEQWNGVQWSVMGAAQPTLANAGLRGVDCVSPTHCVAVGYTLTADVASTFIEVWDGAVWSVVASPSPGTLGSYLESVSCVSLVWCVAVGLTYDSPGRYSTLIESWDGSSWSVSPSPNAVAGLARAQALLGCRQYGPVVRL